MTFDKTHADYYTPGEYWLVKSTKIFIQARYLPTHMTNGLAVTKIVAVGGPLLKGHKLFVGARTAFWDGKEILRSFPSSFAVPGVVDIQYNSVGDILQKSRAGKELHVVHIKIPDGSSEGIQIQINRWTIASEGDYVNVRISMHPQPGQDGHCGNFNGDADDDKRTQVRKRLGKTGVPMGELLFNKKTPVVTNKNRPDINDCPEAKLKAAEATCKKAQHTTFPSPGCLIDACFAGGGFAANDAE